MEQRIQAGKKAQENQTGFTYLLLLFSISILGIGLASTGVVWSTESRLSKQRELEFIGREFIQAIESYYNAMPGEVKSYPQSVEELLTDHRFLFTKRHLRKVYVNPFTNSADWQYLREPGGGIYGISNTDKTLFSIAFPELGAPGTVLE
jgi:type II secretory pathway pseudopilin PulG